MEKSYQIFLNDIMTVLKEQKVETNNLFLPIELSKNNPLETEDYLQEVEHWANYLQPQTQAVLKEYEGLKMIESNITVSYKRYIEDITMEYKAQRDPTFLEKLKRSRWNYYNHAIPPKKQSFTEEDFEQEQRLEDPGYRAYVYWGLTKLEDYFIEQEPPILVMTAHNLSRRNRNFDFLPKEEPKTKVKYIRFYSTRGHR